MKACSRPQEFFHGNLNLRYRAAIMLIVIVYCYTTRVAHDTYMYIYKNMQLRNTEYKSTRIAQQ